MAREQNDWRLTNQEKYLKGVRLFWQQYTTYSQEWDHDHCEFCWAKFMENGGPGILTAGYTTEDNYRWICQRCYEDFKDRFAWVVD